MVQFFFFFFFGLHQSFHISLWQFHPSVYACAIIFLCASVHPSHCTQLVAAIFLCTLTSPRPLVHMCSVFNTLGLDLCTIHAVFGELRLAMNASPVVRPLWCNASGGGPPCLKKKVITVFVVFCVFSQQVPPYAVLHASLNRTLGHHRAQDPRSIVHEFCI